VAPGNFKLTHCRFFLALWQYPFYPGRIHAAKWAQCISAVVLTGMLLTSPSANAAVILAVDFDAGSGTQAGFSSMPGDSQTISGIPIVITNAAGAGHFDRNDNMVDGIPPGFTYTNLPIQGFRL
jgi:hypothetical protein